MLNQIKRKTINCFCLGAYFDEKRVRRERGRSGKKTPEELRREQNGGAQVRSKQRKSGEKETRENESGEKNGGARPVGTLTLLSTMMSEVIKNLMNNNSEEETWSWEARDILLDTWTTLLVLVLCGVAASASAFNDDVDSSYLQASISGMPEYYKNLHMAH
ncbi:hypothetical protein L484_013997 [Morus notabilis]|uniref:Uncharacterized protein n=1 Tax=Morus notabilis TaxID=981085 RepID=W9QU71_9ROSA|nr:hypothetical protein L484_013997 [Morus notabilis]